MNRPYRHNGFRQRNGTSSNFDSANASVRHIDGETWRVIDDWPEMAPVSQVEVEVIDTFLLELVDELLEAPHAPK
ncbi:MAG: hypothetical protein HYX63_21875 [Gammaproteobacteria bacterium]|nr:hypothetical protein [Gammaproteobacteria bacterium]